MLEIYVNAEPQKRNDEIPADSNRDLSVELIYCDEIIKGPIMLFWLLGDYLFLKGLRYTFHRENKGIMYELVNCFSDVEVDRCYERQILSTIKTAVTIGSSANVVTIRIPNDNHDTKVAHNMSTRFTKSGKFSGKPGEDINELTTTYMDAAQHQ